MRKIFLILFAFALFAYGADVEVAKQNAQLFGIWTLIPPLVAIALAFITKDVILSLFIGVFSGTYMLAVIENNIFSSIIRAVVGITERIIGSMADSWNAGIMLQVLTIGGVVALITRMGGTKAIAQYLAKKAKTGVSAQVSTWFMGLLVFFDDYANALIVGPVMRPVTDRFKISRERLAFIIDATAAPIAGIAIISTWVGYEISLIKDSYGIIEMTNINAFNIFVETIPYRFYNLFMLFFVLITALMSRDFGPMYKAQVRAKDGDVLSTNDKLVPPDEKEAMEAKEGIELKMSNAIVPILVLMLASFIGFYLNGLNSLEAGFLEDAKNASSPMPDFSLREAFGAADASVVLFQAALFATIVAMFMGIYRKIFSISEAINVWLKGWKTMIITIVILLLAWSLSSVIKELGTSSYLVALLSDSIPNWLLPSVIFALGSFISFSTGTSYGTMGIIMPLAVPLAYAVGMANGIDGGDLHQYMIMNIGAVLTGAIFGDHCSPISDTTILSSMGSGCNHIDHVSTQIFYALTVGAITILFGYLLVGFGVSIWITLPLGLLATFGVVRIFGKKV
ncbi:MAG: sodium:proton antiporter [Proteobacteria bacterium]|nr:MAG: sodium:proton antiporter [Pseudomonadota bacterium]